MLNMNDNEKKILITAIGNPNVDIRIRMNDTHLFEKYALPADGHKEVSVEFKNLLENEFKQGGYEITRLPGGCAQNTLRVFQWLKNSKFDSVIIGSVGADQESIFLKTEMEDQGVVTNYTTLNDHRTSSVFVLIYRECRSNVYSPNVGAATMYSVSHLLNDTTAVKSIENSKLVHIEGFFTTHSPDVGLKVLEKCFARNIVTSFNICGEYVVKNSNAPIAPYVKSCNIVIGNLTEFIALCRILDIPVVNIKEAVIAVHRIMLEEFKPTKYELKNMEKYKKILIVTNGEKDLMCVTGCDRLVEFQIPVVEVEKIRDTTGAGDSFLAGFLYGIIGELPIMQCLEIGCKTAALMIQQHDCQPPAKRPSFIVDT